MGLGSAWLRSKHEDSKNTKTHEVVATKLTTKLANGAKV
jgi:hypothetical protein